jgi:hypothetical protein
VCGRIHRKLPTPREMTGGSYTCEIRPRAAYVIDDQFGKGLVLWSGDGAIWELHER